VAYLRKIYRLEFRNQPRERQGYVVWKQIRDIHHVWCKYRQCKSLRWVIIILKYL